MSSLLGKSLGILKAQSQVEVDVVSGSLISLLRNTLPLIGPFIGAFDSPFYGANTVDNVLWPGHHMVLFPPRLRRRELASDGYDTMYSPPHPYLRRMWAGGQFKWNVNNPLLLGQPVKQFTSVSSVKCVPLDDPKSIFVTLEKSIENQLGWSIIESRTLVYLKDSAAPSSRILVHNKTPEFSFEWTPDLISLFRYSALTFNSHLIHFDKTFASQNEGYPDCLVHGPLTVTLLLGLIHTNLKGKQLSSLHYRAVSPLIVNRAISFHGRHVNDHEVELWANNNQGSLAMKATATLV